MHFFPLNFPVSFHFLYLCLRLCYLIISSRLLIRLLTFHTLSLLSLAANSSVSAFSLANALSSIGEVLKGLHIEQKGSEKRISTCSLFLFRHSSCLFFSDCQAIILNESKETVKDVLLIDFTRS